MAQQQPPPRNRMVERLQRSGITFRPINGGTEDRARVRQLIQRVYIEEMGLSIQPQHDPYEHLGTTYLALKESNAVGTVRIISQQACQSAFLTQHSGRPLLPMEGHFPLAAHIQPGQRVAEAGRLIVHPDYRRSGVVLGLIALLYHHGRNAQIDTIFCLINHATLSLYEKCGYQPLDKPRHITQYGRLSVPIMVDMHAVAPPFAQLCISLRQTGVLSLSGNVRDDAHRFHALAARPNALATALTY